MGQTLSIMLSVATLLAAPVAVAQTPTAPVSETPATTPGYSYATAMPQEIPGVGFETQKQAFLDILASKGLTYATNANADMFGVSPPGAPFRTAVYFFNSNACTCLTEIELRFNDDAQAKTYFDARYTPQNVKGEYFFHDGVSIYRIKAWRFQSKVYVVAVLENTRWANQ